MFGERKTARPKGTDSNRKSEVMPIQIDSLGYLEKIVKQMIKELIKRGCLPNDFTFLTRQEQGADFEKFIDNFLTAP